MSDVPRPERVFWSGRRGSCRIDGVAWVLDACPLIPGLPFMTEIEFIPGQIAQARFGHGPWRDLDAEQRASVAAWLQAEAQRQSGGYAP